MGEWVSFRPAFYPSLLHAFTHSPAKPLPFTLHSFTGEAITREAINDHFLSQAPAKRRRPDRCAAADAASRDRRDFRAGRLRLALRGPRTLADGCTQCAGYSYRGRQPHTLRGARA